MSSSGAFEIGSVCLVCSHLAMHFRSYVWPLAVQTGSSISSCEMEQTYSLGGFSEGGGGAVFLVATAFRKRFVSSTFFEIKHYCNS